MGGVPAKESYLFFDTETTGLDPKRGHRIIEIAAIELEGRKVSRRHFHHYLDPEREVDEEDYFQREVLPHVPDAWIDHSKTKIGYEIPLNRHFYRYEAPRELDVIEGEIKALEDDIMRMLAEVTA